MEKLLSNGTFPWLKINIFISNFPITFPVDLSYVFLDRMNSDLLTSSLNYISIVSESDANHQPFFNFDANIRNNLQTIMFEFMQFWVSKNYFHHFSFHIITNTLFCQDKGFLILFKILFKNWCFLFKISTQNLNLIKFFTRTAKYTRNR